LQSIALKAFFAELPAAQPPIPSLIHTCSVFWLTDAWRVGNIKVNTWAIFACFRLTPLIALVSARDHRNSCATSPQPTRKLFDDAGERLAPSYAIKGGVRYGYYASTSAIHSRDRVASPFHCLPYEQFAKRPPPTYAAKLSFDLNEAYQHATLGKGLLDENRIGRQSCRVGLRLQFSVARL